VSHTSHKNKETRTCSNVDPVWGLC
jgi:hypothetical protein